MKLAREWPASEGRPRRAGVSSFGISGTNAHVIIEEAPAVAVEAREPGPQRPVPVVVSARTEAALPAQIERLRSCVGDLRDVAFSAATTRAQLEFRAAIVLADIEGMSLPDVALALGVPVGTVKSRVFRARRMLAERLGEPNG